MREAELKVNLEILLLGEHEKDSNQQIEFPDETESWALWKLTEN